MAERLYKHAVDLCCSEWTIDEVITRASAVAK